jgi:hypothetical protein
VDESRTTHSGHPESQHLPVGHRITWNRTPTIGSRPTHGRLKQRLRPRRDVRTLHAAAVVITALAFLQNLRRGGYELGTETPRSLRLAVAFTELASAI